MKNQYLLLLFITVLFACKSDNSTSSLFPKIDKLAKRYQDLGRFSGTILVAKEGQISFKQSYGFAIYEERIPFSDSTAFKIGTLSELFSDHISQEYTLAKQDTNAIQKAIELYCLENGLSHTFYQKENSVVANGYLFHNYRGEGLELQKVAADKENGIITKNLKSTPLDLLKLSTLLSNPTIHKSGYIAQDGFSYTFQKAKNLTIIILSNRRHPISDEIAESIRKIYDNQPYEVPLLRTPFDANTNLYVDYEGSYEVNPNFIFEVIAQNDSLFTLMGNQKTHIIPQSNNQLYYQDFDAAIRFVRDSNQVVSKAVLYNGFLRGDEVKKVE